MLPYLDSATTAGASEGREEVMEGGREEIAAAGKTTGLCTFMSRVFLLVSSTGSGYKPFRLHPDTLHAYVDPFELSNPQGILKVCHTCT